MSWCPTRLLLGFILVTHYPGISVSTKFPKVEFPLSKYGIATVTTHKRSLRWILASF